jgi:HD superfamily phosphodiesterase
MAEALLKETYTFVSDLLKNQLHQDFIYHNFIHTQRVLKSTQEIMEHTELSEEDQLVLQLSALLHDVGYTKVVKSMRRKVSSLPENFSNQKMLMRRS